MFTSNLHFPFINCRQIFESTTLFFLFCFVAFSLDSTIMPCSPWMSGHVHWDPFIYLPFLPRIVWGRENKCWEQESHWATSEGIKVWLKWDPHQCQLSPWQLPVQKWEYYIFTISEMFSLATISPAQTTTPRKAKAPSLFSSLGLMENGFKMCIDII